MTPINGTPIRNRTIGRVMVVIGIFGMLTIAHGAAAQQANDVSPAPRAGNVARQTDGSGAGRNAPVEGVIMPVALPAAAAMAASADATLGDSIVGSVQDPSGAGVTGVNLTIKN